MRFGVLDISRDPEPQGYAQHRFDVVLGYNVVHATRDIEETTGHLRSLLAPDGLLLLVEATRLRCWDEMVWGLTEGWWHFVDEHLRADSPLLGLGQWERILRDQGFQAVEAYPRDERKRHATDAGLVIAQQASEIGGRSGLQHTATDPSETERTRDAIAKVQDIQRMGSEVLVIRADVGDEQQMRAALAQVRERFGALHGVIHTAGILGQGWIPSKTPSDARAVLAPKVVGTFVLDTLLKEQAIGLDFMVLCSSLASLRPSAGQIDYCAANAFLDAYATSFSLHGKTPVISIDWGFWQELGMIERAKMPLEWKRRIVAEIEEKGWSNAGIEAFRRILAHCTSPQVIVSPVHPEDLSGGIGNAWEDWPNSGSDRPESDLLDSGSPSSPGWPDARQVTHPWFDACVVQGEDLEAYISHLNPRRHWVLDEHRPQGQAVLPGTAYLELVRAAVEGHAQGRTVQLSEVYFLTPLVVGDDETKEVRTILKKQDLGFDFVVVSRQHADRDEWQEHARGEVAFLKAASPPHHDLQDLNDRCRRREIIIDDAESFGETTGFEARVRHFRPRWRNFRRVGLGTRQGMASLQLPPEFARDVDVFKLHPALMDMATGFLPIVDWVEDELPFSYKRILIWSQLHQTVSSYARGREGHRPGERTYDVTILDEHGNELVDVEGFTLRECSGASRVPRTDEAEAAASSAEGRTSASRWIALAA